MLCERCFPPGEVPNRADDDEFVRWGRSPSRPTRGHSVQVRTKLAGGRLVWLCTPCANDWTEYLLRRPEYARSVLADNVVNSLQLYDGGASELLKNACAEMIEANIALFELGREWLKTEPEPKGVMPMAKDRYRSALSGQVGKKLIAVQERCMNVKTLVFEDRTSIEIEAHPHWTPSGTLGAFEVEESKGHADPPEGGDA